MILWPRGHMRSRDKLKAKYLLFWKVYGRQTWQGGNLWWGKLTHNVRWPSDHVITRDHVTNWKLNISFPARSLATKYRRLVILWQWSSHDSLTMCECVVTWQIKSITYPLWQGLWPWNLARWWLMVRWTHP